MHVIEVLADSDSRYKIAGESTPEITVKAGERVLLRVTARRGKTWNRDGSIHGFGLLRAKDRTKVLAGGDRAPSADGMETNGDGSFRQKQWRLVGLYFVRMIDTQHEK